MRYLITIFFYFILSFLPTRVCADSHIPFELVNGLMIIDAEVNGTKGYFIFDTGASDVLVDRSLKIRSEDSIDFSTTSGVIRSESVSIKRLKIGGNLELKDHEAYVMDLQSLSEYTEINILGILGGQLIKGILKVDFSANKITIIDKVNTDLSNLQSQEMTVVGGIPLIKIGIENRHYTFILDSGASTHIMDNTLANTLFGSKVMKSNKVLINASGDLHGIDEVYTRVEILGNETSNRFLIQDMAELSANLEKPIHGIISLSSLQMKDMYMDFDKNIVYFD